MTNEPVVLITGSSGLIGSRLIERMPRGWRLIGFDREGPPIPPVEAECVPVDLLHDESVDRALERVAFAYGERLASVVHLAAYYDFSGEDSPLYDDLTVRGTERLLGSLRRHGFDVEQFLFSSTMLVHAPCALGERITEDSPIEAKWAYPESKVRAERTIREHRGSIPALMLRIAGVYDDECRSIPIAHQIRRIDEKRLTAHVFPGDVRCGQSFVHLDDVVEAVIRAIELRAGLPDEAAALIGESETMSYEDLQRTLARLLHGEEDWETREIAKPLAEVGAWLQDNIPFGEEPFIKPWMIGMADDHYALDTGRAERLLGWRPRRSLRATLPKMVASLRRDPARWLRENGFEEAAKEAAGKSE